MSDRFHKMDLFLQVLRRFEASYIGLSLADIEQEFEVGRRTAMRLRDAIRRNFPEMEEIRHDDGIKRWRLPRQGRRPDVSLSTNELALLDAARKRLYKDGRLEDVKRLQQLEDKLRGLLPEKDMRRLTPDVEALMEAEGLATRPGPRPRFDTKVLDSLREAILACHVIEVRYKKRGADNSKSYYLEPYGFIYGHRHYLVARVEGQKTYRLFILSRIESVQLLERYYNRDDDFTLEHYRRQSFGLFQEDPQDIEWRFSIKAAEAAANFYFHPEQKLCENADGTLTVSFKAGGLYEMAWHLLMWGQEVEVIKPASLSAMIDGVQKDWGVLP